MVNRAFGNFYRISKTKARNAYNSGECVFVSPCNLRPDSMFGTVCQIPENENFDTFVDRFTVYNCTCTETGRYASFWIVVK